MSDEIPYPFWVRPLTKEGGGYQVEFPDLPGCASYGRTVEEAVRNGRDALYRWLAVIDVAGSHDLPPLRGTRPDPAVASSARQRTRGDGAGGVANGGETSPRPWAEARRLLRKVEAEIKLATEELKQLGPEGFKATLSVPPDPAEAAAAMEGYARWVLREYGYPDTFGWIREPDGSFRPIRPEQDDVDVLRDRGVLHPCLSEEAAPTAALGALIILLNVGHFRDAYAGLRSACGRELVAYAMQLVSFDRALRATVEDVPIVLAALDRDRRERGNTAARRRPAKYADAERQRRTLHAELRDKHPEKPLSEIARVIARRRRTRFHAEYKALQRLGLK